MRLWSALKFFEDLLVLGSRLYHLSKQNSSESKELATRQLLIWDVGDIRELGDIRGGKEN